MPKKILTFEDCYPIIEKILNKNKKKWQLYAITWMDYDDIKQIVAIHIYKKWHLFDQTKPVEPWVARIVSNQIKNLIRNHYNNFARPCLGCPFNQGGELCSFTKTNIQDSSCVLYKNWTIKKQGAFNIKLPLPLENHGQEADNLHRENMDIENVAQKLKEEMRKVLNDRQYRVYCMMIHENRTNEEIAEFMGFRTSEKKRKAGYKQIRNLREMFKHKIIEIFKHGDFKDEG